MHKRGDVKFVPMAHHVFPELGPMHDRLSSTSRILLYDSAGRLQSA